VFLASVKEDLAKRGDAALLYAKAARLRPDGQVVFIALASLFFTDGQPDEAARMTERLFAPADPVDPWWMYQRGQGWVLEARLARLRHHAQRR
jgi:hypothetical protein